MGTKIETTSTGRLRTRFETRFPSLRCSEWCAEGVLADEDDCVNGIQADDTEETP